MQTYVMMTRLNHSVLDAPENLENLEHQVKERIQESLGADGLEWVASYAVGGPYDYMDVFRAADNDAAIKVSTIVRTFGHAQSEIWPAADWGHFKEMTRDLPGGHA
ncbi:GYD domain-containing protein [Thiohalomonas denitrificans]|uniref:GYD domain-containing protein n=1 Tax=Thiohalomonas denitrificans TaxID=415747 RepID=A0A1G5PV27_9GAMM|nr:GYD domain-containing protein [Thiohalomonas denitrificans]SCZ53100.1 GYD domain-containing protein [Thiohalomonas denitrificans]